MARMARVIASGRPHHVTQRGNRRQPTFFCDEDYALYLSLLGEWCGRWHVDIWAYCLMPNHVHLIAVPETEEGLCRAIGEAHRRYTRHINFREGWRGHLWQGRFASFVMDARYTLAAARYIELNPVRAGLSAVAEAYPWSSAKAHVNRQDDALVKTEPLCSEIDDWTAFLMMDSDEELALQLKRHERTGRPCGDDALIEAVELETGRALQRQKPGPKGPRKR